MSDRTLDIRISQEARRALVRTQRKLGLGQVGDVLRTLDFLGFVEAGVPLPSVPRRLDDRLRARVTHDMAAHLKTVAAQADAPLERLLDAILIDADRRLSETETCPRTTRSATRTTTSTVAGDGAGILAGRGTGYAIS